MPHDITFNQSQVLSHVTLREGDVSTPDMGTPGAAAGRLVFEDQEEDGSGLSQLDQQAGDPRTYFI